MLATSKLQEASAQLEQVRAALTSSQVRSSGAWNGNTVQLLVLMCLVIRAIRMRHGMLH